MFIPVLIVLLIGLAFILYGYLIFTRKAPMLLNFFFKQGVTYEDKRTNQFFGIIIIIIGIIILLLPLILGTDNMHI